MNRLLIALLALVAAPLASAAAPAAATRPDVLFIAVDDLAENVDAARACGWDAVLVDHEGDTAAQVLAALRSRGVGA